MASEDRTATHAVELERRLEEAPFRFGFFWALRQLECAYDDRPRLGESLRASEEPVWLGQEPSLAFAPASIASFTASKDGKPSRMAVRFFGVFGPNGPLPLHLTEFVRNRERNFDDRTFRSFVDVFHHRLLSFFYRAWANSQPTVSLDRPQTDSFGRYIASLVGIGSSALRNRDSLPDFAKLHFSGRFSNHVKNAEGLSAIVSEFFGLPAVVQQFVGHWIDLPGECRMSLGRANAELGKTATIGSQIWDCQQNFRIVMGPMDLSAFKRLLPGGEALVELSDLVRSYCGDELLWDLNLILEKEAIPPLRLDGTARLGWTSWFNGVPREKNPDEVLLSPTEFIPTTTAASSSLSPV